MAQCTCLWNSLVKKIYVIQDYQLSKFFFFSLLLQHSICLTIVKLLLFMYKQQCLLVHWQSVTTDPLPCANSVKQGGVLSPASFCYACDLCLLVPSSLWAFLPKSSMWHSMQRNKESVYRTNVLMPTFCSYCSFYIRLKLVYTYCSSFYSSPLLSFFLWISQIVCDVGAWRKFVNSMWEQGLVLYHHQMLQQFYKFWSILQSPSSSLEPLFFVIVNRSMFSQISLGVFAVQI